MKHPETYFKIASLITKFLDGSLSSEESGVLNEWIDENKKHQILFEKLTSPDYLQDHLHYWENDNTAKQWELLETALKENRTNHSQETSVKVLIRKSLRYAAMAVPVILLCGTGWYFVHYKNGKKGADHPGSSLANVYIMPKGKVAQLVLGNGKVVNLNNSLKETITEKNGTKVNNGKNSLSYPNTNTKSKETIYNTLVVPRGGEYEVTLSDGTKVWLNAASSLRFPVQFNGNERKVFLTGEGYFEVSKDAAHPFVVNTNKMDVTVLGTSFDVSAYPDDPGERTVLNTGSVRVNTVEGIAGLNDGVILKPGYEAVLSENENNLRTNTANMESVLAWKNGMFIFEGEPLGSIMRKLSRWYNVNVKFDNDTDTGLHFTGRIKRFENITGLLNLMELTGKVKFSVVGNEVVVNPAGE
jgi:ferric-dicitrate binding protein FerR (iron transport regulator)